MRDEQCVYARSESRPARVPAQANVLTVFLINKLLWEKFNKSSIMNPHRHYNV